MTEKKTADQKPTTNAPAPVDTVAAARERKREENTATEARANAEVNTAEERATLDSQKSDEEKVEFLQGQGWAPTTARRYLNLPDPNHGLAPDLPVGDAPVHLKESKLSQTDADDDPARKAFLDGEKDRRKRELEDLK